MDLVQLYAVWVDGFVDPAANSLVCLNDNEFRRAAAIRRIDRRAQFFAGRYILRNALSTMLGIPADSVSIKYSTSGRLEVTDFYCTLSHSRGLALLALSPNNRLGVDIQYIRPRPCIELAKQLGWHSIAEWMIGRCPLEQATLFTRMWTRSEALFKALEMSELPFGRTDWKAPFVEFNHGHQVVMSPTGQCVSITDLILHDDYATALVSYPPLTNDTLLHKINWLNSRTCQTR